jgi:hypothetical protein
LTWRPIFRPSALRAIAGPEAFRLSAVITGRMPNAPESGADSNRGVNRGLTSLRSALPLNGPCDRGNPCAARRVARDSLASYGPGSNGAERNRVKPPLASRRAGVRGKSRCGPGAHPIVTSLRPDSIAAGPALTRSPPRRGRTALGQGPALTRSSPPRDRTALPRARRSPDHHPLATGQQGGGPRRS